MIFNNLESAPSGSGSHDEIPAELKALTNWVVYRVEERVDASGERKRTKIPYQINGHFAKTNQPDTWNSFQACVDAAATDKYNGIGFVFTNTAYVGIDLDHVYDEVSGLEPWAADLIRRIASYTELSASGDGVHIIVRGVLPDGRRRKQRVEMYDRSSPRYFVFTGNHFPGTPTAIEERSVELAAIHAECVADPPFTSSQTAPIQPASPVSRDDNELLQHARSAANGPKFVSLFDHGDCGGYNSQSEADLALCCLLAFWTCSDPGRINRLFSRSALYRAEKWGRQDYRESTIAKAIALTGTVESATFTKHKVGGGTDGTVTSATCVMADGWPDPEPIEKGLLPVEPLNMDLLPDVLKPLVCDTAQRMAVPPDFAAVAAILSVAGCVGRRAFIYPLANDDSWKVIPCLWGAIVSPPGTMKTPLIAAVSAPLQGIQNDWLAEHEQSMKAYRAELADYEIHLAAHKQMRIAHIKDSTKPEPIDPGEPPVKPPMKRVIVNDSTVEKLHEVLSENEAGVLILRDELTGWLAQLDKPGFEDARAFYLEGWEGSHRHVMDRITRGTISARVCFSIFGGVQPALLRAYLANVMEDGRGNDGLLQRFQLLIQPDLVSLPIIDRAPDKSAVARVEHALRNIVKIDPKNPLAFKFSPDAQELFYGWRENLEKKVHRPGEHPAISSHLSKYRKLMPALSLLFELVDRSSGSGDFTVSAVHAGQAALLCNYLESHARRVYNSIAAPQTNASALLGARIKAGEIKNGFTARDVYRHHWSGLTNSGKVRHGLTVLEDAGWVRKRTDGGYEINPKVLTCGGVQ